MHRMHKKKHPDFLTDFILLFLPAESCNKCQPGWVFLKSACYYFSSQNTSESRRNWFDSRSSCVSQGGDLLMIDSVEEQVSQRTREQVKQVQATKILGYALPAGSCAD